LEEPVSEPPLAAPVARRREHALDHAQQGRPSHHPPENRSLFIPSAVAGNSRSRRASAGIRANHRLINAYLDAEITSSFSLTTPRSGKR
jgi:hypothetical protein